MKIRYKGKRPRYEVTSNRKSYHFTPENNYTLDIQDQRLVNYIFGLPSRAEFEVIVEDSPQVTIVNENKSSTETVGAETPTVKIDIKPEIKKRHKKRKGGKK